MKKRVITLFLLVAMVTATLVGCGGNNSSDEAKKDNAPAKTEAKNDSQILFNGSTSLAPVITKIATDFNEKYVTWDKVNKDFPKQNIAIYVSSGGSGQGVKAVIDGTTNYGMLARGVKDKEKKEIKDFHEYQVGIDALTIAVNPKNPVTKIMDNLSKEQIIGLFSGKYKTWKDLDAKLPEKEIVVITRDINGGAHEVFQKKIMGKTEVKPEAIQAASMGELVQNIIDNEWAIGYASYGVANQNKGKVFTMKVDGVEPTAKNIIDGSYIIQRPLLLIQSGEPTAQQKAFLDVVLGSEGQKIVEKMGFIPVK